MAFFPNPKREYELEAAWTVAAVIGGIPERRDRPDSPNGTHDFDITLRDGTVIALEVTSHVDEAVAALWRDVRKTRFDAAGLRRSWSIQVRQPTGSRSDPKVKDLRRRLPHLLKEVEPFLIPGCVEIFTDADTHVGPGAEGLLRELRVLGVTNANPLDPNGFPAQIQVGTGGLPRHVEMDRIISSAVARKSAKLLSAQAEERHLFLWIDGTDAVNWPRLYTEINPPSGPAYASGVDVIWIGLWSPGYSTESWTARLWTIAPDGTWTPRVIPAVRRYAKERQADGLELRSDLRTLSTGPDTGAS